MQRIRLGVIGFGFRIGGLIERMAAVDQRIVLVAMVDPSADARSRARAISPQLRLYDDAQGMADDPTVDWVVIGSPNYLHVQQAIPCVRAGKHIICEKPIATNMDDAIVLKDEASRAGCMIAVGFTLRYASLERKAYRAIRDGLIGNPISVDCNETLEFNHGGMIHGSWRSHAEFAGSHLLEKCCHDIDVLNWLLESRARRVASFGGCNYFTPAYAGQVKRVGSGPRGEPAFMADPRSTENPFLASKSIVDNQVVMMEYDNDVRVAFHLNCCTAIPERRLYICGSEGTLRADRVTGQLEWRRIGWDEPVTLWPDTRTEGGHGGADETICREWIAMMTANAPPAAGLEEGLAAAVTCYAIDDAMSTGQVLDLKPYWERVESQN